MCQYAKKTVEQILDIMIIKYWRFFKNFTFGLSLATAAAELSRLIGLFYTVFQKKHVTTFLMIS